MSQMESFAALFEESLQKANMRTGEVISAEVVRIEHNFVYPGEETYSVLSPPPSGPQVPSVWPFGD